MDHNSISSVSGASSLQPTKKAAPTGLRPAVLPREVEDSLEFSPVSSKACSSVSMQRYVDLLKAMPDEEVSASLSRPTEVATSREVLHQTVQSLLGDLFHA